MKYVLALKFHLSNNLINQKYVLHLFNKNIRFYLF